MKGWKFISSSVILVVVLSSAAIVMPKAVKADPGSIVNPSFETGDLSGWIVSLPLGGEAVAVTSYTTVPPVSPMVYTAFSGSYFARIKTNGPGSYSTVSQTFSAAAGDKISGWAWFVANDYMPFDDNAHVHIKLGATVLATVFSASVSSIGDYGQTPWTYWEYTFTASGTYTVEAHLANVRDSAVDSQMGLDAVFVIPVVTSPTPRPTPRPSPSMAIPRQLPPVMALEYLAVNPQHTYAGQPVTITTNVSNAGGATGSYTVVLMINGQQEATRLVSAGAMSAVPVKFTVTKDVPGTYTVTIGNQQSSFTILGGGTSGSAGSGGLIVILIMGVLVLATVVVLMLTFRRPA